MSIFFTSDHHFGHDNVIKYCSRPFASSEEMDEEMVRRWNEVISPADQVYYLGDFALCHPRRALGILRRLNGEKHLVAGNHDRSLLKQSPFVKSFTWVKDIYELKVADETARFNGTQRITLCHYAMRTWNQSHRGAWNLHGHSHGNLITSPGSLSLDVGVDVWDFRPISYEQVRDVMSSRSFSPVDHHREDL